MQLARYIGNGVIAIAEEPTPSCPAGGILVRTEACGLCSGELMAWYMDRKVPHVLGHEVAGLVVESDAADFPVGARVFPHHHAPCRKCELCRSQRYVHCPQWKRTKLSPGGMADFFAAGPENLTDCVRVDDLRAIDAALIEPLACVMKALRPHGQGARCAVVGLGVMGLLHALMLPGSTAFDLNPRRVSWARNQGVDAHHPDEAGSGFADEVYVLPGSQAAFDFGLKLAAPGASITMFAPLPSDDALRLPSAVYFQDLTLRHAYSCGPNDTQDAVEAIRAGRVRAESVVSDFITMAELPAAYIRMGRGDILKAMVVWPESPTEALNNG